MTFAEMREFILSSVRKIGDGFNKPDADWLSTAFVFGHKGMLVAGLMLTNSDDKDQVPAILENLFVQQKATVAGLVMSCWTLKVDNRNPLAQTTLDLCNQFGVRTHPDREECLIVYIADEETYEQWQAKITRGLDRPSLGEFEKMDFEEKSGRFANLLPRTFTRTSKRRKR